MNAPRSTWVIETVREVKGEIIRVASGRGGFMFAAAIDQNRLVASTTRDGVTWQSETVPHSGGRLLDVKVVLLHGSNPCIVAREAAEDRQALVAYSRINGSWTGELVTSDAVGGYAIAAKADGSLWITYSENRAEGVSFCTAEKQAPPLPLPTS